MRIKLILILLIAFGLLFTARSLPAGADGEAGQDIAVLKAGVGARPLGMGGAFTAVSDNADSPYWNPGALGFINHNEITTMQTKLSTDADHYYVSYVSPVLGGTLGISWIQVGMGNIVETSAEVDVNNEVIDLSVFSYFSNAYLLSFGRKLSEILSFGITAKYLTADMLELEGGQASGYSITPGLLMKLTVNNNELTLGLKLDELINQQIWDTGTAEQVPAKLRLGIAYRMKNPGLIAADVSQILKSGYGTQAALGYEWQLDGLSFRLGYRDGVTAGAGFEMGNTRVDYAYVTQRDLTKENVHRISLTGKW
jgi:hypothetical protein